MRLTFEDVGTSSEEHFLLKEARRDGEWTGTRTRMFDTLNLGEYLFMALSAKDNRPLYSYGFGFEFAGHEQWTSMSHTVRFPFPKERVQLSIKKRTKDNSHFVEIWSDVVDPASPQVQQVPPPHKVKTRVIFENGPPAVKVDIVIIGDGYTDAERSKFDSDASRAVDYLFSASPFKENRRAFNVRSAFLPSEESGITSPLDGVWRRTAISSTYNGRGIERRIEPTGLQALRDIAAAVPYDYIIVITNTKRYGGSAEFRQYSIAAIDSVWSRYLIVHEFGHNFAGLDDEYFSLAECHRSRKAEPWSPNVTAAIDRAVLKWGDLVSPDTPIATPWDKDRYVEFDNAFIKEYLRLREDKASESDIDKLIADTLPKATAMLASERYTGRVGVFEGASDEACSLYRPEVDCTMFTLNPNHFCAVCTRAIERVIQFHSE